MLSRAKVKTTVGLDIEAGSIAASQVRLNGAPQVEAAAVAPLGPGAFKDGEVIDPAALSAALQSLFSEHKLPRKVRVGVANQRLAVRPLRLPSIEKSGELETAIRFQAQEHIPMPLDDAVLDYQIVGQVQDENGATQLDVVAVAARREMIAGFLAAIRGAGLRPVGIDLSAFGMIRALAGEAGTGSEDGEAATAYCHLGDITTLAVARGQTCLFTRTTPFGLDGVAQRLAERRGVTLEHAREWIAHVGLEKPVEEIEGDAETVSAARDVLTEGASKLADELRLSLEFYGGMEGALAVERVIACGSGATIPGLAGKLAESADRTLAAAQPKALSHLDDSLAARLTLSYGLALEQ